MKRKLTYLSLSSLLLFILERYFVSYRPDAANLLGFNPAWFQAAFYAVLLTTFISLLCAYFKNDTFTLNTFESIQVFALVALGVVGIFLYNLPLLFLEQIVRLVGPIFQGS